MRRHRDQDAIVAARPLGLPRVPLLNVGLLPGNLLGLLGEPLLWRLRLLRVLLPVVGGSRGCGRGETRLSLLGWPLRVLLRHLGLLLRLLRRILLTGTGTGTGPGARGLLRMRPGRPPVPRPALLWGRLRRLWRQRRPLLPLRLVRGRGIRRSLAHGLPWIRCRGC
ncbi:hypothetical protein ACWGKS_01265 [Nocardiopsis sp. NPDC055879]